jgi:hypothetical protein
VGERLDTCCCRISNSSLDPSPNITILTPRFYHTGAQYFTKHVWHLTIFCKPRILQDQCPRHYQSAQYLTSLNPRLYQPEHMNLPDSCPCFYHPEPMTLPDSCPHFYQTGAQNFTRLKRGFYQTELRIFTI